MALLLALLAAAMEHSLAAAEYDLAKSSAAEMDRDLATKKAAEDKSSAAAPAMKYDLDKSSVAKCSAIWMPRRRRRISRPRPHPQ